MDLPFTVEQFRSVFVRYNLWVSPAPWVLYGLALSGIVLLASGARRFYRIIYFILALFWLWSGVVYHIGFFTAINPAAYLFGGLFIAEGLLLAWFGLRPSQPSLEFSSKTRFLTGAFLVCFALVIYPAISFLVGHRYPATPTFGLPCPTTLFTMGVLLWSKPPLPPRIVLIPLLWSAIGLTAAVQLGMYEDFLLLLGLLTGSLVLLTPSKRFVKGVMHGRS
jgi:hypothetical protein